MKLADRVAQCRECDLRFALTDKLTRRCAALAYSKGARTLGVADLLHIPAGLVWVEWNYFAWQRELERHDLRTEHADCTPSSRRGALISSSPDRRRGTVRTFWTNDNVTGVLASSVEGWFDLDRGDEHPEPPDEDAVSYLRLQDPARESADVLKRYFRFRYERSWQKYYHHAPMTNAARDALARHALGMIAADIPLVLAFFLLLTTRRGSSLA